MTDPATFAAAPSQRVVRVFVSSTFRDMQAEREELVKRVFPKLRKLCDQRGVIWGDVDLRWGITEEQAHRGEVLPICLAEIDRCRPYFVGLLGERYGWVPESVDEDLLAAQPWLAEHRDRSVTDLEILHGVLRNPRMAGRAFFYFRSPSYVDSFPPEQQADFREVATLAEIERWGPEEAARRAEERCWKLADLKERIRASGLPVREDYADPQALAELVLNDLTALIEQLFPEGSQPDPLDREAAEHDAFARSRLGVYIGRPEYFRQLDAFARTPTDPSPGAEQGVGLVVRGASGSGKSALLANWLAGYQVAHPEEVVLYHAIGATPQSADGAAMLRRLLGEFRRRLGVQVEVPSSPVELQRASAGALYQAAARGKVVLVLDALNQLEDRDGMPDLLWLPPELPANVRLIVSALPGRSLEELLRRRWPALEVRPLEPAERTRLIVECLRHASKALSEERVRRLASTEQSANPLFLRALLEELRVFGVHERLDERIAYYLAAPSLDELFARILERYEADYERERPGLVGAAMTLLWVARRGLAEEELLQLLGDGQRGEPLPQAYWSPLYLAAEHALMNRAGLIGFFHDFMRRAVERRYLPEPEQRRAAHRKLAGYFAARERDARAVDELPGQLAQAEDWGELYTLLTDLDFFQAAWDANEYDVKAYWVEIEAHPSYRLLEGYRPVLQDPAGHAQDVGWVARLLAATGHTSDALSLYQFQVERYRGNGDLVRLMASLGNQAKSLWARGEPDAALTLLREQEALARQLEDADALAGSVGNQAIILQEEGNFDEALKLYEESDSLCRSRGNLDVLQQSLGNRVGIFRSRGDLSGALALLKQQEQLSRQLGNLDGLHRSLGSQAVILKDQGNLGEAQSLHAEVERICRRIGNRDGLQVNLINQAIILEVRGELDEALRLLSEQEDICRQTGSLYALFSRFERPSWNPTGQGRLGWGLQSVHGS